jgi:hypothetical protein
MKSNYFYIYFIFLIVILGINIYYSNNICSINNLEQFDEYPSKKTVILVITQDVAKPIEGNMGSFWGLGDIIRGMISVYQTCKELNYDYIIDMQLHPMSKFFKKKDHPFSQYIKNISDMIYFRQNSKKYILNMNSNLIVFSMWSLWGLFNRTSAGLAIVLHDFIKTIGVI